MPIPRSARSGGSAPAADEYQDVAVLNRIASARFGWQPRFFNPGTGAGPAPGERPDPCHLGRGDRIIPPAYAEAFHR